MSFSIYKTVYTKHNVLYRHLCSNINELTSPTYSRALVESDAIYDKWERNGVFRADNASNADTFSMILPPHNASEPLHIEDALGVVWSDALARAARSREKNVLWLPGIDNDISSTNTQVAIDKYLGTNYGLPTLTGKKKQSRKVNKWIDKNSLRIQRQLKLLGASLDWSRQYYTADKKQKDAIISAFIQLYDKGLIYRDYELINWNCYSQTVVNNSQIHNYTVRTPTELRIPGYDEPVKFGLLTNFAYKIYDSCDEIIVSTTRPETMLGVVAIAINPSDGRYVRFHNCHVIHPFKDKTLPIILDPFVDINFGTGAVSICPSHNYTDYGVAKKHGLKIANVIDDKGLIIFENSEFDKLKRFECREVIKNRLNELGLLRNEIPYAVTLPICSKSGDVVELLVKERWFLSCKKLIRRALKALENRSLIVEPERFVNELQTWLQNEGDWCISKDSTCGIRVPAYKCWVKDATESSQWFPARSMSEAIRNATKHFGCDTNDLNCIKVVQTIDNWFCDSILPFSSLGWPEKTIDFSKYYPFNLLITNRNHLNKLVSRMVIVGMELTNTVPFKKVLLHGNICDSNGVKISKNKGNILDFEDVIKGITFDNLNEKIISKYLHGKLKYNELDKTLKYYKNNFSSGIPECGVDALRFTLCSRNIRCQTKRFDVIQCYGNTKFCNKLWQSVRYSQLAFDKYSRINGDQRQFGLEELSIFDMWILSRLSNLVSNLEKSLDNNQLQLATSSLKRFLCHDFCDVYLETTKPGFEHGNISRILGHTHTTTAVLNAGLRCLSPIMIFITEALIPKIPKVHNNCIKEFIDMNDGNYKLPLARDWSQWRDTTLENDVNIFIKIITFVRRLKSMYLTSYKLKVDVYVKCEDEKFNSFLRQNVDIFTFLSRGGRMIFDDVSIEPNLATSFVSNACTVSIKLCAESIKSMESVEFEIKQRLQKVNRCLLRLEYKVSRSEYASHTCDILQSSHREQISILNKELAHLKDLIVKMV